MKCFSFAAGMLCVAAAAFGSPSSGIDAWQKLPLRFEENRGQSPGSVQFTARSSDYQVSLTPRSAVLQAAGAKPVQVTFPGATAGALSGQDRWHAPVQYFRGRDRSQWLTGVAQYSRVRYSGIYPGVDVVFYGQGRQLEYDFVLQPGADPNRIFVQFDGADSLAVTAAGDLEMRSGEQTLVQKRPVVYQTDAATGERHPVQGSYRKVGKRKVQFTLASYDRRQPLVIDPVLSYASYLGGGLTDAVTNVVVDSVGLVYVCGYTDSTDLTLSANNYSSANSTNRDLFIAQLNPNKAGSDALLYLTYLGGSGRDEPRDMAIDQFGVLYITGLTTSANFPLSGYSSQTAIAGTQDAFALKFDVTLNGTDALPYSTYLGGSGSEIGYGIAVDNKAVIYVTGVTYSDDFPIAGNSFQNARGGPQAAFVARLDPSQTSSLTYSTFFGQQGPAEGRGIAVEPSGIIDVAGSTNSINLITTGNAYQSAYQGGTDVFIARFDPSKTGDAGLVYSTFIGGGNRDEARKLRLTPDGKLLVTGFTLSNDFPVTANAAQGSNGGNGDAFVLRLNPQVSGTAGLEYSTFLGGADADLGYDIAAGANNTIWITGYTLASNFPVQGALNGSLVYLGATDGFVTRLDPSAPQGSQILFSTYLGGSSVDVASSIAISSDGTAYVAGYTTSGLFSGGVAFPSSPNAYQVSNNGGGSDGFLAIIRP